MGLILVSEEVVYDRTGVAFDPSVHANGRESGSSSGSLGEVDGSTQNRTESDQEGGAGLRGLGGRLGELVARTRKCVEQIVGIARNVPAGKTQIVDLLSDLNLEDEPDPSEPGEAVPDQDLDPRFRN